MYHLNAPNSDDAFNSRTKNVFDSLSKLESTHNAKVEEYQDKSLNEDNSSPFKVPSVPTAPRRSPKVPDHVKNPHKWQKYSLEDVDESQMSSTANYQAAFSFLKARQSTQEATAGAASDEPIVFNRPLVKKHKTTTSTMEEEENNDDDNKIEVDAAADATLFRRKPGRKNLRKLSSNDDEEEEDTEVKRRLELEKQKHLKKSSKRLEEKNEEHEEDETMKMDEDDEETNEEAADFEEKY